MATEPQGYEVDWTDPASLIALKATGCDCRKHGYRNIHDLCIADAARVRPHIVPLVEAVKHALGGIGLAYESASRGFTDEVLLHLGHHEAALRRALNPEE
jgi:hypothetical protein